MSTGNDRRPMPDTALANAFLIALAKWAEHHADSDTIVLPTGTVTGRELRPVLRALFSIREPNEMPAATARDHQRRASNHKRRLYHD